MVLVGLALLVLHQLTVHHKDVRSTPLSPLDKTATFAFTCIDLTQKRKVLEWKTRPYTLDGARFAFLDMSLDIFGMSTTAHTSDSTATIVQ